MRDWRIEILALDDTVQVKAFRKERPVLDEVVYDLGVETCQLATAFNSVREKIEEAGEWY